MDAAGTVEPPAPATVTEHETPSKTQPDWKVSVTVYVPAFRPWLVDVPMWLTVVITIGFGSGVSVLLVVGKLNVPSPPLASFRTMIVPRSVSVKLQVTVAPGANVKAAGLLAAGVPPQSADVRSQLAGTVSPTW